MSQSSNMELVENLRPFIHKMVEEYLLATTGLPGGGYTAGDNIDITAGEISLVPDVVIGNSISTPSLKLWDNDSGVYREVLLRVVNGQVRLYVECT